MNAVVVSVLVMLGLSLLRVNVILALIIAAFTGGLLGGLGWQGTLDTFIGAIGSNAEIALSYALLGALAVAIAYTGLMQLFVQSLSRVLKGARGFLLVVIAVISSFSQNLIPVHIAFIPILIPPLLALFNRLKIDRRAVAVALTFGLQAPYMLIPAGFGLVFHKIVQENVEKYGLSIELNQLPFAMLLPTLGMVVGLFVAIFITYRKPREYQEIEIDQTKHQEKIRFNFKHLAAIIAILIALVVQLQTESMVLGGLSGLVVMYVLGAIKIKESDELFTNGVKMMAFIGFIMLVAGGYAEVINATGQVESLVKASVDLIGQNKLLGSFMMLLVGLLVTMGIGTSFGTVPILAPIYVPLAAALGFSPLATVAIIGTAGALGDAGSPASDSTLGPSSGLNADGQHNHIWDTTVPTFIHFNIPIIVFGWIAAMIL
ncbi:Na+/H+ antiporter family protein [Tepidibacillus sp. HK-1]|uniref:Na+/H+ antiporter family protein n=1 Tax=Tepidibacillus sp. HK-1 TaxID=1883407 RepID=UPI000853E1BA|nr:Na+/H+ antiporter family protein [Tepidibacillus sp. HK-1]GBF10339.1 Na+/H+ antiporter family protein [Tepidibacillus sp. HK-1]